jgi:transcriptional regulator with XRE-family HTH domain
MVKHNRCSVKTKSVKIKSVKMKSVKIKKDIGLRIHDERIKLGLSTEEFAAAVGISASYVGLIERGLRGTNVKLLVIMCTVLNCTLDDIVFGKKLVLKEPLHNEYSCLHSFIDTLSLEEAIFAMQMLKLLKTMNKKYGTNPDLAKECFY